MYFLNLGDLSLSVLCNDHNSKLKESKKRCDHQSKLIIRIGYVMPLKSCLYAATETETNDQFSSLSVGIDVHSEKDDFPPIL